MSEGAGRSTVPNQAHKKELSIYEYVDVGVRVRELPKRGRRVTFAGTLNVFPKMTG